MNLYNVRKNCAFVARMLRFQWGCNLYESYNMQIALKFMCESPGSQVLKDICDCAEKRLRVATYGCPSWYLNFWNSGNIGQAVSDGKATCNTNSAIQGTYFSSLASTIEEYNAFDRMLSTGSNGVLGTISANGDVIEKVLLRARKLQALLQEGRIKASDNTTTALFERTLSRVEAKSVQLQVETLSPSNPEDRSTFTAEVQCKCAIQDTDALNNDKLCYIYNDKNNRFTGKTGRVYELDPTWASTNCNR